MILNQCSYPYDGGNVQISLDDGETWEVINPMEVIPANSVTGLDGEPGYYGQSSNNSAFAKLHLIYQIFRRGC